MRPPGAKIAAPGVVREGATCLPFVSGSCPACGATPSAWVRMPAGGAPGRPAIPPPIGAALLRIDRLSSRERVVFQLLGLGYDNRSLARELRISERTAKRHVTAILAKLGLESRLQAGLTAMLSCRRSPAAGRDPGR